VPQRLNQRRRPRQSFAEKTGLYLAAVMVYADDVTHIVTEEEFVIGEMEN
jgi:hypothetical protein